MLWDDGMAKSPERWQKTVEENGDDVVQLCCWGKMRSVPVIVSHGKKQRNLSAKPLVGHVFHLLISAAISWRLLGMTPHIGQEKWLFH